MLQTKLFTNVTESVKAIHDYQQFVRDNPHIEIISVNTTMHDWILLTFKD